jgi:hypothetical protein
VGRCGRGGDAWLIDLRRLFGRHWLRLGTRFGRGWSGAKLTLFYDEEWMQLQFWKNRLPSDITLRREWDGMQAYTLRSSTGEAEADFPQSTVSIDRGAMGHTLYGAVLYTRSRGRKKTSAATVPEAA